MKASLIDLFKGRFDNEIDVRDVEGEVGQLMSIRDNLQRLFNSREGAAPGLPEYGLPDIYEICRSMPQRNGQLARAMRENVQKFEPRLRNVRVEEQTTEVVPRPLAFILSAELQDRRKVRFQVVFPYEWPAEVRLIEWQTD